MLKIKNKEVIVKKFILSIGVFLSGVSQLTAMQMYEPSLVVEALMNADQAEVIRLINEAKGTNQEIDLKDSVLTSASRLHLDALKAILEAGGDPNEVDGLMGYTPLEAAVFFSSGKSKDDVKAAINLLLDYGANPSAAGEHGVLYDAYPLIKEVVDSRGA